jgi:hypothetical protein
MTRQKKNPGNWKIHPHDQCGICSKPRTYKAKTMEKETRQFESAPRDRMEGLCIELAAILVAIGHPEAYITDESSLGDFALEPLEYALAEEELGIQFKSDHELLVDIAERLKTISTIENTHRPFKIGND